MSENWDFYPCRVEGEPASIMLNLGLHNEAPVAALPECAWLRITLKDPRPDGLSSSEEFDRLCEIGDALDAAVDSEGSQLSYVGRCTCGGRRDFYTYAQSGLVAEALLSSVMSAFPEYEFDTGFRPDPDWRLYRDFLYPTSRSMQLIQNRRLLDVLEQRGDESRVVRPIRHFADFAQQQQADTFVSEVMERGFAVVSRSVDDESARHFVVFEREDAPEFVPINNLTLELLGLAESHNGRYDGWETSLEQSDSASDSESGADA